MKPPADRSDWPVYADWLEERGERSSQWRMFDVPGYGDGDGVGYGDGDGYGYGYGDSNGYGHGHGYGYGDGHGYGDGNGTPERHSKR